MNDTFWQGKRVLVTGADGFMGSHLVEALVRSKARVVAFTRSRSTHGTSQLDLRHIGYLASELERVIAADISNPETTRLIEDAAPAVILHLAADAYVPRSFTQPGEVFAINANGTLHVLEAARRLPKLERVVLTSSSEIYGTAKNGAPIDEDHPLLPTSPYGASKVAADRLAHSYRVTFGLPVAVIRPFNTYGPRHSYDVVPKFIKLALAGQDLTVHGTGEQARDFTYVDDTVRGFLVMGSHPDAIGEVVNFGSGTCHSIRHLAERVVTLAGSRSHIVYNDARVAEVQKLLCNPARARRLFGWRAEIDLEEGLRRNIEWARDRAS
jgi:nucleoside-diphosphate-sugar epimerase